MMTDVWLWTPWFTVLILAALQSLPTEPHEAARIDECRRVAGLPQYHAACSGPC